MRKAAPLVLLCIALGACEDEDTVTIDTPAGTIEAEEDGDMTIKTKEPQDQE